MHKLRSARCDLDLQGLLGNSHRGHLCRPSSRWSHATCIQRVLLLQLDPSGPMLEQLEGLDLCASWASNEAAAWQRDAQTQEHLAGARLVRASSRGSVGGADRLQRTASIYSQQLNDLLSQANQCAAVLGSRYRYVAARQRPQSAASGQPASTAAPLVERRAVNVRTCFQSVQHN